MANEAWTERQTRTPEARRRYEEERLILWTTEVICEAMEERGLNRPDRAGLSDIVVPVFRPPVRPVPTPRGAHAGAAR